MTTIDPRLTGPNLKGDEINGTENGFYDLIWLVQECMTTNRRLIGFIEDAKKENDKRLEKIFEDAKEKNEEICKKAKAKLQEML